MRRFYDTPEWKRLARRHLAVHPLCAVAGCGRPASHCDHVLPLRVAPQLRLAPGNLQSLCHSHHSILTRAFDAGRLAGACDASGYPLDPAHPWAQPDQAAAIRAANRPARAAPAPAALAARLKLRAVRRPGRG